MTTFTRRSALAAMGATLATPALMSRARAAEVTLRIHHFLPAVSAIHRFFFEPWAAEITEATDGAVAFEIYPSMQLGGKPPQLADQARQGICDIAWTLPVYTPDRFPVAETMSIPFMTKNAEATSVAMHTLMDEFGQDEYRGIHVLAHHTHDGGKIHTRNAPVTSKADLQGLKLRAPNQAGGDLFSALGAEVVFFPVPDLVVGLSNGQIDGCCLPYEIVPAIKLHELTSYTAEAAPAARGIYCNTFTLAMNQAKYEGLSDDVRAVIDANSGMELSRRMGRQFDEFEAFGRNMVVESGNPINEIPAEEIASWQEEATPVYEAWVEKLNGKGLDGAAILARANELLDAS